MATATDQGIELHAGTFRYREWGSTGRPMLLLHGAGYTSRQWDLVAPFLAQNAQAFAVDLRGHGESAKPDDGYDLRSEVADIRELEELLALDRPVVIGHSWGASIALHYAAQEPGNCAGVVLVDGGVFESASFRSWEETAQELLNAPQLDGLTADTLLKLLRTRYATIWSAEVEEIFLANFRKLQDGTVRSRLRLEHRLKIARANYNHKPSEVYEHVQCPVLIVLPIESTDHEDARRWNEQRRASSEAAQRVLSNVQVEWLNGCSHNVPLERPRELAGAVRRFLSTLRFL